MVTNVSRDTLSNYAAFTDQDARYDYNQGVTDGRRNFPSSDQTTFGQHEMAQITKARTALNKYMAALKEEISKVDADLRKAEIERDNAYHSRQSSAHAQRQTEIDQLNRTHGEDSPEWRHASDGVRDAERAYQREEFRAGRPAQLNLHRPLWRLRFTPYMAILLILSLLEIPINERAIDLAFQFPLLVSYLIAFFVGLVFVMLAHQTGIMLQRVIHFWGQGRSWGYAVGATVLILFAAVMIYILFEMRVQVDAVTNTLSPTNLFVDPSSADQGQAPSIWDRLFAGDITEISGQLGLMLMNTVVFLLGTAFSIIRHDPDPSLERSYMELDKARSRFMKIENRYNKQRAKVDNSFEQKIVANRNDVSSVAGHIAELQHRRDRLEDQAANDMRMVVDVLCQQIAAYQKGNAEARGDGSVPPYFGRPALLRLKDHLVIS